MNAPTRLRSITLAILAVGAVLSLGIAVYAFELWKEMEARDLPEAVGFTLMMISPYLALAVVAWLVSRTTLASAVVLLGSALTTMLGLTLIYPLLIRVDAEGILFLLAAGSTQWTGVLTTAGAAGACLLIQWSRTRRGLRSGRSSSARRVSGA